MFAALPALAGAPAEAIPLSPISALLQDADGNTIPDGLNQPFRVRGVAIVGNRALQSQAFQLMIEDPSGGLSLFTRAPQTDVEAGQEVEASGRLGQFRGAPQLYIESLQVLGRAELPEPRRVPLAEADSWQHHGRRVQVEGRAGPLSLEGYGRLRLDGDDGSVLNLYIPQPVVADFDWSGYPRGARLQVTGVSSLYKETWPYDGGFQLVVTSPADIVVLAPPTPAWMRWGLYASLPAAVLLALSLFGFALVQRRQRLRQQEMATLSALSAAFAQSELDSVQLSRRACDTLCAYGVVGAACVHLVDPVGGWSCAASSADSAEHQRQLEAVLTASAAAVPTPADPASAMAAAGLPLLASHALPAASGSLGWLSVPALGRRRLRPMQLRILLATVKLLALALENRRIREQAERERAALHQLAVTDELTGLYNRRYLDEYLRTQIPVCRRRGSGLAFLAVDIDHFKAVNDQHGHPVGDAVLRRVAEALRRASRSSDLLVRMGGEEFLVLAAETELAGAHGLAERIRAEVAALAFDDLDLASLRVTVSLGLALFGLHGEDAERLLQASDEALYAAKRAGRNRVEVAAASGEGASQS